MVKYYSIVAGALLPFTIAVAANVIVGPFVVAFGVFIGTIQAFILRS